MDGIRLGRADLFVRFLKMFLRMAIRLKCVSHTQFPDFSGHHGSFLSMGAAHSKTRLESEREPSCVRGKQCTLWMRKPNFIREFALLLVVLEAHLEQCLDDAQ